MIKIYTFPDKRPDFILRQKKTLDMFLKDDFEYIIINNGSTNELIMEIEKISKENKITHFFVENPNHKDPTIACAYPINQSLNKFIKKEKEAEISVIIDSDMFFLKHFSISDYLCDNQIAAVKQIRGNVNYIWNGIVFINHKNINGIMDLDFGFQSINGELTDVGGNTYFYFKKYPNCVLKNILHTSHIHPKNKNLKVFPPEILCEYDFNFCFELYEKSILHYGRGSNWDNMPINYHENKTNFLDKVLNMAYNNEIKWTDFDYVFDYDCWKRNEK
jgi:hypothetical protein